MSSTSSNVQPALPFSTRVFYYICTLTLRNIVRVLFFLRKFIRKPPPGISVNVKSYPSTPHLSNRIFTSSARASSASATPPPLYLSLHGGAFAFADPTLDDGVSAKICADWNVLVISLDYPKSPGARYPIATQQIVSTILSILADTSLEFDPKRIAIGGYSAGGQLALSACLDPRLKDKVQAVVAFYPVVDFTTNAGVKAATRPYTHKGQVDGLTKFIPLAKWAYVPVGQDLKEPELSAGFAHRDSLPPWVCAVGAEMDILCCEAGAMMGRLAGKKLMKVGDTEGLDEIERNGFEAEEGKLKWVFAGGAEHGFTHDRGIKKGGEEGDGDRVLRIVGEWLWKGAFAVGE